MERALVFEAKSYGMRVYHLLRELDPARFRPSTWNHSRKEALRQRIVELEGDVFALYERLQSLTHELPETPEDAFPIPALRSALKHVGQLLSELKAVDIHHHLSYLALYRLCKKLQKAYQQLCVVLEMLEAPLPHIRPSNLKRSLFHVSCALFILLMIEMVPSFSWMFWIALGYFIFCWSAEGLKRLHPRLKARIMKLFATIAHPHEYDTINSATWYGVALLLLSLTNPTVGVIGVTVLGVADPAAAAVGRSYGRIRLPGNRTLEGSLGFFVAGTLSTALALSWLHPLGSLGATFWVAACAALAGAIGELLGKFPDDNLTVPVFAALGGYLALLAL